MEQSRAPLAGPKKNEQSTRRGGGKPGEALRRSSRNDKHTRKNKAATNHSVTPAKQAQVGEAMLLEVCPLARARGSSKGSASTQVQRTGHGPLQRALPLAPAISHSASPGIDPRYIRLCL
eukprot:SM000099S25199  [mRNA]  locus=s99:44763:45290:- [translate_table: standard]